MRINPTYRPVNAAAARVLGGGFHFDDGKKIKPNDFHQDVPPRCIPPEKWPQNDEFKDLRGLVVGRLTVVGYLGKTGAKRAPGRWLVRCACGQYEARKTKWLKNPNGDFNACMRCSHVNALKYGLYPHEVAA